MAKKKTSSKSTKKETKKTVGKVTATAPTAKPLDEIVDTKTYQLIPGETVVSLNYPRHILYAQGSDGVNLSAECLTQVIPEGISDSNLRALETAIRMKRVVLGEIDYKEPSILEGLDLEMEQLDFVMLANKIIEKLIPVASDEMLNESLSVVKEMRRKEFDAKGRYTYLERLDAIAYRIEGELELRERLRKEREEREELEKQNT